MTATNGHASHETSPLVASRRLGNHGDEHDDVNGVDGFNGGFHGATESADAVEPSESNWYLFLLTLSIGGLQVVWSVELSNGSPYLLSLGMSKALLAMVWIAGPLTGTLVQPYVGIRSDNCRVSWGKRKPFMVVGGAATVASLLGLAWVRELIGGILSLFGVDPDSAESSTTVIVIATIFMYCLDFSINTVQAAIRAFIVDNAPAHQQETANAWASGLTGVGNILGFLSGYLDLPQVFPFFGNTQFKVLCAIATISLSTTLCISCSYIKERDPRLEGPPASNGLGVISFFKQLYKSIRNLPPQIAKVCEVQIASWVGWFPFLYYSTTYIGQLYVNPVFEKHPNLPKHRIDEEWARATRKGTFALLINAIITFSTNTLLPFLVVRTYKQQKPNVDSVHEDSDTPAGSFGRSRRTSVSSNTPLDHASPEPLQGDDGTETVDTGEGRSSWLSKIQIPGLTLRRAWFMSHLLFAACMFSTFFVYSGKGATVVIGILGMPWALTLWAPFAFISAEVARIGAEKRTRRNRSRTSTVAPHESQHQQASGDEVGYAPGDRDLENGRSTKPVDGDGEDENLAQAGIILGLHNMAISFPQIISSLVSSVIFKTLQKPRGEPWDDSVAWVLRFGGCAALLAAWLARRLK